jgi:uncharacterized protein YqgC (DUF456 family)
MTVPFRKIMHLTIGILVVLIGIAGLVLPIINGTLLLIVGFIIISFESPYVEKKLFILTQKNKFIHSMYLRLEKILRNFFRK